MSICRVVKETIGAIAESEKEVEYAAREMEYIIRSSLSCLLSCFLLSHVSSFLFNKV